MDITATILVQAALWGLLGGIVYVAVNRLLSQALFLSAIEHLVASVVVGVIAVVLLGYAIPVGFTVATVLPLITAGYFALDILDGLVQSWPNPAPAAKPE
jgi:hypothetical protein